jgi:photoactive yellow protein
MEMSYPVLCAWCGVQTSQGSIPHSHSICRPCSAALRGVPLLSEEELSKMPYGVIELDPSGTVLIYNKAEEALSGKGSASVIGKNFFREVAPCTSVKNFEGRFVDFLSSQAESESFKFTFHFPERTTKVSVAFVRTERSSALVLVKAVTEDVSPA